MCRNLKGTTTVTDSFRGGLRKTMISYMPLRRSTDFSLKVFLLVWNVDNMSVCVSSDISQHLSIHLPNQGHRPALDLLHVLVLGRAMLAQSSGSYVIYSLCAWTYNGNKSGSSDGIFHMLLQDQLHKQVKFLGTRNTVQLSIWDEVMLFSFLVQYAPTFVYLRRFAL